MRLEDYWGVGPKTSALLESELGVEAAIEAIEAADVQRLVAAGLSRGRATRILRHAHGEAGMDLLATGDTRSVYKDLLDLAADHAVTRAAADRIQVLTPLSDRGAMEDRLDEVMVAVDTWRDLDGSEREAVLAAFDRYDGAGGERGAVRAALDLQETGVESGIFAPIAGLDPEQLRAASDALGATAAGGVREGVDDRLDGYRTALAAVEELAADPRAVLEAVQAGEVRDVDRFRTAFVRHVSDETGADAAMVREAAPEDPPDAAEFVAGTLRTLVDDLQAQAREREAAVQADLSATIADARETIDAAVAAVADAAFFASLARFALAYDLTRPAFLDGEDALAVVNARNLGLAAGGGDVQPVTYGIGDHGIAATAPSRPPAGDRVAVLTGANSGGKTTLLETLCQVALLAHMGLPVPADRAEVSQVDAVVFHRRHASFNAGVLESTLRTIVPPLTRRARTLMLVDEFEAITEPGSAADLLHGLVTLTVDRSALGVFVTHLADDLQPLPDTARTDGIFAQGLDPELRLEVDYQPRFEVVGKSTPEFIVSRLLANAGDARERVGYETLARGIGQAAVQRTLTDARWSE